MDHLGGARLLREETLMSPVYEVLGFRHDCVPHLNLLIARGILPVLYEVLYIRDSG